MLENDVKYDENCDFLTFSQISQKCFPWLQNTLKTCSEAFSSDSGGSLMILETPKIDILDLIFGANSSLFKGKTQPMVSQRKNDNSTR